MKAKDLMQGDYITFKDALKDGIVVPVKIVGLGYVGRGVEDEALVEINGDKSCDIIEINDECVGIPLTAEILEKNGFLPSFEMGHETLCLVSSEYSIYYRPVDTYLYVFKRDNEHGEGDFIVSDHRNKNAKYVHELQHALRFCRIDKEIVL